MEAKTTWRMKNLTSFCDFSRIIGGKTAWRLKIFNLLDKKMSSEEVEIAFHPPGAWRFAKRSTQKHKNSIHFWCNNFGCSYHNLGLKFLVPKQAWLKSTHFGLCICTKVHKNTELVYCIESTNTVLFMHRLQQLQQHQQQANIVNNILLLNIRQKDKHSQYFKPPDSHKLNPFTSLQPLTRGNKQYV